MYVASATVYATPANPIAISPLQYKRCCGGHYYRIGEGNLPERMTQILNLGPERVEFITWVSPTLFIGMCKR